MTTPNVDGNEEIADKIILSAIEDYDPKNMCEMEQLLKSGIIEALDAKDAEIGELIRKETKEDKDLISRLIHQGHDPDKGIKYTKEMEASLTKSAEEREVFGRNADRLKQLLEDRNEEISTLTFENKHVCKLNYSLQEEIQKLKAENQYYANLALMPESDWHKEIKAKLTTAKKALEKIANEPLGLKLIEQTAQEALKTIEGEVC